MKSMKTRYIIAAAALWLMPVAVTAQVDKRVEVTKEYTPVVSGALKLPIAPDMADTVTMKPDIDYSITPLMYSTELVTVHNFKPSTLTYWDFNRPTNFYLKLGAGYPVNTVADFYMSSHNTRTGYIMAAANHYGEFGKQRNYFDGDGKRNILKANTTGKVAGGLYLGKHMFEGELAYDSRVGNRYGAPAAFADRSYKAEYEDFRLNLRVGDDFVDLSRINFDVSLFGDFYHDKSDLLRSAKLQQFDFGGGVRVARRFDRHYVEAVADYRGSRGIKDLHYTGNTLRAGVRYGYRAAIIDLLVGGDYCCYSDYYHDICSKKYHHAFLPDIRLLLDVTNNEAVTPFVEFDGKLINNDCFSLARSSVYYDYDAASHLPSTLRYELRGGIFGKFGRGRFGYRAWAGFAFSDGALYRYIYNYEWMRAVAAGQEVVSVNAELEWHPLDGLTVGAGVSARFISNHAKLLDVRMADAESPIDGWLRGRYTHKKFSVGASVFVSGASKWTSYVEGGTPKNVRMPWYADIGVDFEWKLKEDWRLFVEGSNLANMQIYRIAYYREQGIRCTAGIKFIF